jgi:hypothetical protein
MAYYQCFKTRERTVYCSSTQFKSHQPASEWVRQCMANFNINGQDLHGKPFESDDQPDGATIWP